ncbi:TetR/AcrR family transcriptional regulator [Dactylosporangium roseum]|nr:TetR/AcrR family transcriptional regulator [Dactylosporangium roseum]
MAQRRLTADDWSRAALGVIADSGLAAVAVEPLAARLGATKGSFYWHFPNRDALIDAALRLWEQTRTDAVIALVEAGGSPTEKLRVLFTTVLGHAAAGRLEGGLMAAADHPSVGPVVHRVAARRLQYVVQLLAEAGFGADEARHRALLAYSAYLGQSQLAARLPELLPTDEREREAYTTQVLSVLLSHE